MKIIAVDNFDRETHDDKLICDNISKFYGEIFVRFLNERYSGVSSDTYFRLVEDNYVLYEYAP